MPANISARMRTPVRCWGARSPTSCWITSWRRWREATRRAVGIATLVEPRLRKRTRTRGALPVAASEDAHSGRSAWRPPPSGRSPLFMGCAVRSPRLISFHFVLQARDARRKNFTVDQHERGLVLDVFEQGNTLPQQNRIDE